MDLEVEMVKANDVLGVDGWQRCERDCSYFNIKNLLAVLQCRLTHDYTCFSKGLLQ